MDPRFIYFILLFAPFCMSQEVVTMDNNAPGGKVPTKCLQCLCEAATECKKVLDCEFEFCGLFRISWPYWIDAGKPVIEQDDPDKKGAWLRCVWDPFCAATAVQNYMARYERDCNGDGKIDCLDYAAIHHFGPFACNLHAWDKNFYQRLNNCFFKKV